VLDLLGGEEPPPAEPPAAPTELAPVPVDEAYYADFSVTAQGRKEGDQQGSPKPFAADVFINGRLVGTTPYEDGLPTGTYKIEVKSAGRLLHAKTIDVTPGGSYVVEAEGVIPLTDAERAEIDKRRQEEHEARQEMLRREWEETRARWEDADRHIRDERRPFLVSGTILMIGGVGLVIGGAVLEAAAVREQDRLEDLHNQYQIAYDLDEIAWLEEEMDAARHARDVNNALGITFLVVGGAAVVTSIVLYSVMPAKLEEPTPPAGLIFAGVEVSPLVAPDFAGLGLSAGF
jgi:hypothetical protein